MTAITEHSQSPVSGPHNVASVTPHDSNDLANTAYCLWVGAVGDVRLITLGGQTVTLSNVAAGMWHAMPCTRILSTGTEATEIFVGYMG